MFAGREGGKKGDGLLIYRALGLGNSHGRQPPVVEVPRCAVGEALGLCTTTREIGVGERKGMEKRRRREGGD